MVSGLVEEKFIDLLHEYAEAETRAEITRQVLYERRDFDAYSAFRRVNGSHLTGVSRNALKTYLNDCGLFPLEADLDLLFWNTDKDGDGLINWTEFLETVMSKENAYVTPQYGDLRSFTIELEHSLMRIFEQEMVNQRNLEDARRTLSLSSFTESKLFDLVDLERKGWLTLNDLDAFLKSRYAGSTYAKSERAFRRMDEDRDGKVVFEEFLRAVRPVYMYPTYAEYYNIRRTASPLRNSATRFSPLRKTYSSMKVPEERYKTPEKKQIKESVRKSNLLRSSYASPMKGGCSARKLAQTIREEVLQKSVERVANRSRYYSPLRELEKERCLSAAKLKADSRIRYLENRYWSPARGYVYYSPLRESLYSPHRESINSIHRESINSQLRESYNNPLRESLHRIRERELLRESLLADSKYKVSSALKSTAEKSYGSYRKSHISYRNDRDLYSSYRADRELSPVNQSKMIVNLNDAIYDNKILEDKRVGLALRYDFCLHELFSMMDINKSGHVSLTEFERFSLDYGVALSIEDLSVIIDRYDKDRDGMLSFVEFSEIFLPKNDEYRRTMLDRVERSIFNFYDYTILTQTHIKDLLRTIVTVEDNFECNKIKLSDGRILSSDEIFRFLDKHRTGYVTLYEFTQALNEAGVYCSDVDCKTLFEQFDKNKDGIITFEEFHSPAK